MSVTFGRAVRDKLRQRGVTVHEWIGWESRGNGQTSNYQGGILHHTASAYGMAPAILVNGRVDLSGPLCNSAGNYDGSVTMIAAHPANHAGASGGRSMGPLPVTSSFNKFVWGHEIVYPGDQPMTNAQYNTMIHLGEVLTEILGRPNSEWIRGHAETSITGKWDPGYASGRTIDLALVRKQINTGGDDFLSALSDTEQRNLYNRIFGMLRQRWYTVDEHNVAREVAAGTAGAYPATVLDSLDGNYIIDRIADMQKLVVSLEARVANLETPDVDEAAIASAVVQQINLEAGKIDAAELQAAVEAALVKVNREQWNK